MTIGRALELALLVEHGQWEIDASIGRSTAAAAVRFAASPVDLLADVRPEDSNELLADGRGERAS